MFMSQLDILSGTMVAYLVYPNLTGILEEIFVVSETATELYVKRKFHQLVPN